MVFQEFLDVVISSFWWASKHKLGVVHKMISSKYQSNFLRIQLLLNWGTIRNAEFIRIPFCRTEDALQSSFNTAGRAYNHAVLFLYPTLPLMEFIKKLKKRPDRCFGDLCKIWQQQNEFVGDTEILFVNFFLAMKFGDENCNYQSRLSFY